MATRKGGHGKGSASRHQAAVKSWVTRRRNAGAKKAAGRVVGRIRPAAKSRAASRMKPTNAIFAIDPKTRKATKIKRTKGMKAPLLKKFQTKLAARKKRGAQSAAEWRAIVRGGKRGGLETVASAKWRK